MEIMMMVGALPSKISISPNPFSFPRPHSFNRTSPSSSSIQLPLSSSEHKFDMHSVSKPRIFFLDVNPICYNGSQPSLRSFAHWVSLFFSQVTLDDPVVAVLDGERGNVYRRKLMPSYKAHRRKRLGKFSESRVEVADVLRKCNVPCLLGCLTGDEVDGVPGIQHLVPGFGRKTALKLLKKHGSLENLLNAAAIRTVGKRYAQDALTKYADFLRKNYEVLSLRRDANIRFEEVWLSKRDTCNDSAVLSSFVKSIDETQKHDNSPWRRQNLERRIS